MDLGFETVGNATLICHDREPVLVTDPWIIGSAYFGSWGLHHEIPAEQLASIHACRYVWISHGHPDHLSVDSLARLREKTILLPNHRGGRIARELGEQGFSVRVLGDHEWVALSDRIRVYCIADVFQDAILLVDLDGRLVVDANDAIDRGGWDIVREELRKRSRSFLLALSGYGDADMMNFFDEAGARIPPFAARRVPIGPSIAARTEALGARFFVPFSSMHRYERTDSAWANEHVTPLAAHAEGFASERCEILPPFLRYDCVRDDFTALRPAELPLVLREPAELGDVWSDPLEADEIRAVGDYLRRVTHLSTFLGFVRLQVGGVETTIDLDRAHPDAGITLAVPRNSLMAAVRHRVFDDLLIGNFMRVTLHGTLRSDRNPAGRLYPDFTPFVAKYADNGGAFTAREIAAYLEEYRGAGLCGDLPAERWPRGGWQRQLDAHRRYM